jgi:GGDEF domain-containing protein
VSKADELRLLREAIKSFPDAVAVRSADAKLIACSDLYARLAAAAPDDAAEFQAIRLAERRDRMVAALLIRLDDFRQVNDALGHDAGDALLRDAAAAAFRAKQLGRNQIRFFARAG